MLNILHGRLEARDTPEQLKFHLHMVNNRANAKGKKLAMPNTWSGDRCVELVKLDEAEARLWMGITILSIAGDENSAELVSETVNLTAVKIGGVWQLVHNCS